jgi:hypothetical protein
VLSNVTIEKPEIYIGSWRFFAIQHALYVLKPIPSNSNSTTENPFDTALNYFTGPKIQASIWPRLVAFQGL